MWHDSLGLASTVFVGRAEGRPLSCLHGQASFCQMSFDVTLPMEDLRLACTLARPLILLPRAASQMAQRRESAQHGGASPAGIGRSYARLAGSHQSPITFLELCVPCQRLFQAPILNSRCHSIGPAPCGAPYQVQLWGSSSRNPGPGRCCSRSWRWACSLRPWRRACGPSRPPSSVDVRRNEHRMPACSTRRAARAPTVSRRLSSAISATRS